MERRGEREGGSARPLSGLYSQGSEGRLSTGTEQFHSWMCFGIRDSPNFSVERRRDFSSNGNRGGRGSRSFPLAEDELTE